MLKCSRYLEKCVCCVRCSNDKSRFSESGIDLRSSPLKKSEQFYKMLTSLWAFLVIFHWRNFQWMRDARVWFT